MRYSNMHTTALCSPSRSCILTGRNHHSNAMAAITELASGYPGYNGVIPFENGFLSEMLVEHGYSTFLVGKYHLTPSNQETGAGPFDRWPLGRGFQRFYGFLGGDTRQWYPDVPDWGSLPPAVRRLYSRFMEVFAGFLSHTDHQVGRLVEFLRMLGELDNTLVMVISDNGASAEGGPTGTTNEAQFFNNAAEPLEDTLKLIDEIGGPRHINHYPWGWTWAGNTPFRRWKRENYRGRVTDPVIVSWPQGITARGEVRTQYTHIIDMVPTVLDLLGIEPPKAIRGVTQSPLHGVSFARTLHDAAAETSHHTQYFEMLGHRAIYHDGWRAVCPWPGPSFTEAGNGFGDPISGDTLSKLDATGWELYHVAEDFAETRNVAAENRDRLIAMIATWYVEAGKYQVMPVDSRGTSRFVDERPKIAVDRRSFTIYPGPQG